jgi:hypothetical protein
MAYRFFLTLGYYLPVVLNSTLKDSDSESDSESDALVLWCSGALVLITAGARIAKRGCL